MPNTLNDITLPPGLTWSDRHQWAGVTQEAMVTMGGEVKLFVGALASGRPITLAGDEESAWFDQTSADGLQTLAALPGAVMTLTWEGEAFSVVFRHQTPPALELKQIWRHPVLYTGSIKLMEV